MTHMMMHFYYNTHEVPRNFLPLPREKYNLISPLLLIVSLFNSFFVQTRKWVVRLNTLLIDNSLTPFELYIVLRLSHHSQLSFFTPSRFQKELLFPYPGKPYHFINLFSFPTILQFQIEDTPHCIFYSKTS